MGGNKEKAVDPLGSEAVGGAEKATEWPDRRKKVVARYVLLPVLSLFMTIWFFSPALRFSPYASLGGGSFVQKTNQFGWGLPKEWLDHHESKPALPSRIHQAMHGWSTTRSWLEFISNPDNQPAWSSGLAALFALVSGPLFWLGLENPETFRKKLSRSLTWLMVFFSMGWIFLSSLDYLLALRWFVFIEDYRVILYALLLVVLSLFLIYKSTMAIWQKPDWSGFRRRALLLCGPLFIFGVVPFWVHGTPKGTLAVYLPGQGWRVTHNVPTGGVVHYRNVPWMLLQNIETRAMLSHIGHGHYPVQVDKQYPDGCTRSQKFVLVQDDPDQFVRINLHTLYMPRLRRGHKFQAMFERFQLSHPTSPGKFKQQKREWFVFSSAQPEDDLPQENLGDFARKQTQDPDPCYCPMEIDYKSLVSSGAKLRLMPLTSLSALRVQKDGAAYELPSLYPWLDFNPFKERGLNLKPYVFPNIKGSTITVPAPTPDHPQYPWLMEQGLIRTSRKPG